MITFHHDILSISQYLKLSFLSQTVISVVLKDKIVEVHGRELVIIYYESAELKISGVIENINFIRK